MKLEFDPRKSAVNQTKHGIDFKTAQAIWLDVNRLEIPARSVTEARFQIIGRCGGEVWSAFVTYRGDAIRMISVRRARQEEKAAYDAD